MNHLHKTSNRCCCFWMSAFSIWNRSFDTRTLYLLHYQFNNSFFNVTILFYELAIPGSYSVLLSPVPVTIARTVVICQATRSSQIAKYTWPTKLRYNLMIALVWSLELVIFSAIIISANLNMDLLEVVCWVIGVCIYHWLKCHILVILAHHHIVCFSDPGNLRSLTPHPLTFWSYENLDLWNHIPYTVN